MSKAFVTVALALALGATAVHAPARAADNHDRVVACNWSLLAIEHGPGAESKLYAADYAQQRCELPGMLKEVEAAVCDIWKTDHGATEAECKQWLEEFRRMRGSANKLKRRAK